MLEAFIRDFEINSGRSLNIVLADLSRIYHIFENTVVNTGCQIIVRFNVKNYGSVRETGRQKIKKGIDKRSAVASSIYINTIMNTLMRIRKGSSYDILCVIAVLQYVYEISCSLKWDQSWIRKALFKMCSHKSQQSDLWVWILKDLPSSKNENYLLSLLQKIDILEDQVQLYFEDQSNS